VEHGVIFARPFKNSKRFPLTLYDSREVLMATAVAATHSDAKSKVNRLELLLFRLGGRQCFGINVLKVKELMPRPKMTCLPGAHAAVAGVTNLRGQTFTVIDLLTAIGGRNSDKEAAPFLVVTEFNRSTQGLLVRSIDRIVVLDWTDVKPPSYGLGRQSYLTGITRVDDQLVEILDVERVLGEVGVYTADDEAVGLEPIPGARDIPPVLVVDDSAMARKQTARTLDQLGLRYIFAENGEVALLMLRDLERAGEPIYDNISMVISDIEMPAMDGYTLTRELRRNASMKDFYILLHTSLNGIMNAELAASVGPNATLTKFVTQDLAKEVRKGLSTYEPR